MIFGKTILELKVGIFVFVGLVILVLFILTIGGFQSWTSGYNINFTFGFINGVKVGAPIRFAGMDAGEVKAVKFIRGAEGERSMIQVTGWVRNDVKIPADSTIWVNMLGLLGEMYIEIMPGLDYANNIKPNQTLAGSDPVAMHEVGHLTRKLLSDIDESVVKINNQQGTIGKLLYDDTIYKDLEAFVADLKAHPWKLFWKGKETKTTQPNS